MSKKFFYVIICIFVIFGITFFTLSVQVKKRNQDIYNEQLEIAKTGNYTDFIKYQTYYHKPFYQYEDEHYKIDIFITITSEALDQYELAIFVKSLSEVTYATSQIDEADQSKLIVSNDSFSYQSKDQKHYGDFPVSYGLGRYGFYYYLVTYQKKDDYNISLFDYNDLTIYQTELELPIDNKVTIENDYVKGFTDKEITAMLGRDKSYLTPVYIVFSLLVGFSVALGYFYFKKLSRI